MSHLNFSATLDLGLFFSLSEKSQQLCKEKRCFKNLCLFQRWTCFHIHHDLMGPNNQLMAWTPAGILFCLVTWNELLIDTLSSESSQMFQSQGQPVHLLIQALLRSRFVKQWSSGRGLGGQNPSALGSREPHIIGLSLTLFSARC